MFFSYNERLQTQEHFGTEVISTDRLYRKSHMLNSDRMLALLGRMFGDATTVDPVRLPADSGEIKVVRYSDGQFTKNGQARFVPSIDFVRSGALNDSLPIRAYIGKTHTPKPEATRFRTLATGETFSTLPLSFVLHGYTKTPFTPENLELREEETDRLRCLANAVMSGVYALGQEEEVNFRCKLED